MATRRLPILESVSTILVLGVALLLTAIPFGPQTDTEGPNAQLTDSVSMLRTAVFRFSLDHGEHELSVCKDGSDFAARLLGEIASDGFRAAPYLTHIPQNPLNNRNSIRLVDDRQSLLLNGSAGWVYVRESGKLMPDLPGDDFAGRPFREY